MHLHKYNKQDVTHIFASKKFSPSACIIIVVKCYCYCLFFFSYYFTNIIGEEERESPFSINKNEFSDKIFTFEKVVKN